MDIVEVYNVLTNYDTFSFLYSAIIYGSCVYIVILICLNVMTRLLQRSWVAVVEVIKSSVFPEVECETLNFECTKCLSSCMSILFFI